MIFIWGKRQYGAIGRVGKVSIQTRFGHFWYLPLFPIASFYIEQGSKNAWRLKRLNWTSVAFGYARVWLPLIGILTLVMAHSEDSSIAALVAAIVGVLAFAAFGATFWLDRRPLPPEHVGPRLMMERHFGAALDPYYCGDSLHEIIDNKRQASSTAVLSPSWYRQEVQDLFLDRPSMELALLRARCDRTDAALQQVVLQKMLKPANLI